MTVWVNDCYTKAEQDIFHKGIITLDEVSKNEWPFIYRSVSGGKDNVAHRN